MDYPKSVPGVGLVDGKFVDENEQTGQQGSLIPAAWANSLMQEILNVQAAGNQVADESKSNQLLLAIQKIAGANAIQSYSITALPTADIGPIIVREVCEVWRWSSSAYFNGYRSPLCGRPVDGHTITPLASEVDAIGGLLPKSAYAGLWGYAQENGLVVTQAYWAANIGGHYFVDVDAATFRVPDLRNMFRRYAGTDADTANAVTLGSTKADTLKSHSHNLSSASSQGSGGLWYFLAGAGPLTGSYGGLVNAAGYAETAPKRVAYAPRIHV